MKKIFILLTAVMVLLSSVSLAEDLSSMPDGELLDLFKRVSEEIERRYISSWQETSVMAMLYYVPEGGAYYHLDPNCKTVNEKFLPMQGSFTYAELEDEPYKELKPCAVCAAPPHPEKQEPEISFREAVEAAGEFVSTDGGMDYFAVAMEKNGKFIRMVTLTDEHAKELYTAAMEAEDSGEAYEAFQEYTWSLPVTYTEVFTEMPKEQAELDALYGKTVGELLEEGYSFYGISGGSYEPTIVYLSYDPFVYEFETDAPFEQYYDGEDWVGTDGITVKNGMFSGFSGLATDLHYHADGTFVP